MPSREAFACIRDIDASRPETWQGERVFLTFDIDWAHEDVLSATIDDVERAGVRATWFVTHDTPVLGRLRENPDFELGIHPNFNFLMAGDPRNGATAEAVVDALLRIVPEAGAVRSHSTMVSTPLLTLFAKRGLRHDCNTFIPHFAGIDLKPWTNWTGMTMVPYYWEDDVSFLSRTAAGMDALASQPGLKVFDFHPIHVFLNTENAARYEGARSDLGDPDRLIRHRNTENSGTRTVLTQLLGID